MTTAQVLFMIDTQTKQRGWSVETINQAPGKDSVSRIVYKMNDPIRPELGGVAACLIVPRTLCRRGPYEKVLKEIQKQLRHITRKDGLIL